MNKEQTSLCSKLTRLSAIFALFGLVVASTQHFRGWAKIMGGKFSWGEQWYVNAWMLSGFAIFILTALLLLIWRWRPAEDRGRPAV